MGKPKSRGNGQGSVFYRSDRKCWAVQKVTGWKTSANNHVVPIKKTLSGFKTKKDALKALNTLLYGNHADTSKVSLQEVYDKWKEQHSPRILPKTMKGYEYAYRHFEALHHREIKTITAAELQQCMDKCPAGKRTHEVMKVLAGLLWGYALDANVVNKDITKNLYTGKFETTTRPPLSEAEIKLIKEKIGESRYAEYIYALCYLGFRPGEMLELKKNQVHFAVIENEVIYYIVAGKKTEAGKNRTVVIPSQILDIILDRLYIPGTDILFPLYIFNRRKNTLVEFRPMSDHYFNAYVFKPITQSLGIHGKVPYSARHSYANKLKKADGDNRDKAALIGHTDYNFTQLQYQTSELLDLKKVTDSIE